ncbi:MAG TPA: gamma-glutamyl-gamma-aminobutyrate hydrolase family protein [Actinotalea sp.]|nr:gamma-glutamyl-gamma-aminobutyrate hydrolase family protein [Actinotalea sp.]
MAEPRPVLVLVHVPWESAGLIGAGLATAGVPVVTRTVVDEPSCDLPRVRDLAGLVVMGGPMNADDDARHPGLAAERRLLAAAVEADLPVLGVCLGMQLLARALGAAVHTGPAPEIGFAPVDVRGDDPVLAPLGARPTVLHWHGDVAELPSGATLLASSPNTPVQAFRTGSALGLQFHLEVDATLLASWLEQPVMTADLSLPGAPTPEDLAAQGAAALPWLVPAARLGLAAFTDQVLAAS